MQTAAACGTIQAQRMLQAGSSVTSEYLGLALRSVDDQDTHSVQIFHGETSSSACQELGRYHMNCSSLPRPFIFFSAVSLYDLHWTTHLKVQQDNFSQHLRRCHNSTLMHSPGDDTYGNLAVAVSHTEQHLLHPFPGGSACRSCSQILQSTLVLQASPA